MRVPSRLLDPALSLLPLLLLVLLTFCPEIALDFIVFSIEFELHAHLAEEGGSGVEDRLVGDVDVLYVKATFYPLRQFLVFPRPCEPAIREHHQTVVIFATHYSAQALRTLSHGVKLEELVSVDDLLAVDHETDALEQNWIVGVLNRKAYHDDTPTIVALKIDTLCDFTSCDCQEDAASADIASFAILFQTLLSLWGVFLFDEDILILYEFLNDATFLPVGKDVLHVYVRRKEAEDAVGDYLTQTS